MNNYRSISLSSIFLKIWEWIVIILYGDKLRSNDLQFGFQKNAGTEICTWALLEAITNRKSLGIVTFMDCSKAFDKVLHSKMFSKLLKSDINLKQQARQGVRPAVKTLRFIYQIREILSVRFQ